MRKSNVMIAFFFFLAFIAMQVFAGPNDEWKSCCQSGCDYTIGQSVSVGGTTYYCCPNGWQTSSCPTTTTTTQPTTTTTTQPTTTTTQPTTTTTTQPLCSCSACNYYSSSNCNNACGEWKVCTQVTCQSSGCSANTNCYTCNYKNCSQTQPKVYILTPYVSPYGELKVSVEFACEQWSRNVENLTLELQIDREDWSECFLNKKGLMSDFGWNSSCDNIMSGRCGKKYEWSCTSEGCKHDDYKLWVKSNFNDRYVNLTFSCRVPTLSPGPHTLNITVKVYGSEIKLIPSRATFRVAHSSPERMFRILLLPIEILRKILSFNIFIG